MEIVRFDDLSANEQEELMAQHEISLHSVECLLTKKHPTGNDEAIEALQSGDYEYLQELHNIAAGKELY